MNKVSCFFFTSLLVFTTVTVSAQARHQPFRFEMTAVDAKTHQPRSTFFLGEPVPVRVALTNQSRIARTIAQLPDTTIRLKLSSMLDYENGPEVLDSYFGGTGTSSYRDGFWSWGDRPPVMITIAPGQTVSIIIADVGRHFFHHPLQEGSHKLTAKYNSRLRANISFRVVVDEAKTIALLEQLASDPVQDHSDSITWARISLKLIRQPSISGRVVDTEGRPLKEYVEITVTGTQDTNSEGRNDGRYRLDGLTKGGTYTITPSIPYYNHPGVADYVFEPASKTISNLNGNITDVNFTATKIRVTTNFALADEGSKTTASSIRDDQSEPEHIIDGFRMATVWKTEAVGWNDGTPNAFPDWIQVDFGGTRRIDLINVFTLPDNYKDHPEPTLNQTFSKYGITDFDVQYWTRRGWLTVPGGAIRGNRRVWRMISFPVIVTDKIRVVVWKALGGESRITEVEALHLNDLPQAKIVAKASGHTNSLMHFRTEAFDRDGTIRIYELDFGDKTSGYEWRFDARKPGDKPKLTHSHVYVREGTYTVRLKVVDDNDEPNDTTILLTITDPPKRTAARNRSNH